ncbi:MAG TPA: hypothetical protein VFZ24_09065 [Longimicrobiales bacterium]
MLRKRLKTSVLAVLVACAALSCAPDSRTDSLLGPESIELEQPQSQSTTTTTPSASSGELSDEDKSLLETQGYYWIREPAPVRPRSLFGWLVETVEATIALLLDVAGGVLELLGHSITVPPGAVTEPTMFTMTVIQDGYIEVDLTATPKSLLRRLFSWSNPQDVQFAVPVELSLTYERATNVTDPTRLKIMRLLPDGRHEILPSTVDTVNKTVTAELDHFSRYCMISD